MSTRWVPYRRLKGEEIELLKKKSKTNLFLLLAATALLAADLVAAASSGLKAMLAAGAAAILLAIFLQHLWRQRARLKRDIESGWVFKISGEIQLKSFSPAGFSISVDGSTFRVGFGEWRRLRIQQSVDIDFLSESLLVLGIQEKEQAFRPGPESQAPTHGRAA